MITEEKGDMIEKEVLEVLIEEVEMNLKIKVVKVKRE